MRLMISAQQAKYNLELKHAEIALREVDHNQKLADKSIEAQAEDRKDERRHASGMQRRQLVLIAVLAALVFALIVIAMTMDKDTLATQILQLVLAFVGGFGTNALMNKKPNKGQDDEE